MNGSRATRFVYFKISSALVVCELNEGEGCISRNVEAMLLGKSRVPGEMLAKQDTETENKQIPSHMF